MRRFGLVIFDLDGTLVDSRADIAAAVNHAIGVVAGKGVLDEAVYPYIGEGLKYTFGELTGLTDGDRIARMVDEYKRFFYDHCDVHSRVYPGVAETLKAMGRFHRAVATTKMTFMARRVVNAMGLLEYLDHVQGSDEIPLKPDPTLFRLVIERFGEDPARTLVVGDTEKDVLAGIEAGCVTAAVTYGIRSAGDLESYGPDYMVDAFPDLLEIVAG